MSYQFLELLPNASLIPVSGNIQSVANAANFQNQELSFLEPVRLSEFGTTITKQDPEYVEFNYYYFEKSKPNKLSGVL
jgi:hypothetical protein